MLGLAGCSSVKSVAPATSTTTPPPPLPPSITSVSPNSGPIGTSVTITGANFGATQGASTVTFNGIPAAPASWSATSIVVPVPAGAATGNVIVTVSGVASAGVPFTVATNPPPPTPAISNLSPPSGPAGTSVTITGTNFGVTQASSQVTFNQVPATITTWSATSIVAIVPPNATSGYAVVTVNGLASSGVSFTVLPTPAITNLSPPSGPAGTSVTITGTNFGATQASSQVTFNQIAATITNWSATAIVAIVPANATSGYVVVTVNSVSSAGVLFTLPGTPGIASLSPPSGPTGTSVTITGTNFSATQGTSTLTFDGATVTPTIWGATSITFTIPAAATTGNVIVTVNGIASNAVQFSVFPVPVITSLSPTTGAVGVPVTITGTNFGASTGAVTFNTTAATPTAWSPTSIVVSVPTGATNGNVVVTANGVASAGKPFTVAPITISPRAAALVVTTQTQQFTAWITGGSGVNWLVDGIQNGNTSVGTIINGLYTPPSTAGTHTVTATSTANSSVSATATVAVTDLAGVSTFHNSLSVDGTNLQEYALTPANVNSTTFGKLFSCPVDGATYTQPLWVPNVNINGGIHNVIFVATQHDSLFAFDADASPCVQYWQVNLLDSAHGGSYPDETSVPWKNVGGGDGDIQPEVGVTGTPVIDPSSDTIYVVSKSENVTTSTFYQRLHALDLATGNEKFSAPELIQASVLGVGQGNSGGVLSFDPRNQNQRPGLTLAGGVVYIAWASHEDEQPFHGWLIGYSATDVQAQTAVFNTTPNGGLGGIWASGGSPAVDSSGAIYVSTGNGVFDANTSAFPIPDYGDSILRLDPSTSLSVTDWFTPDDQQNLANNDIDLGSGAVLLLPDQPTGPVLHLLAQTGKEGVVYLIDRDNMGHYQAASNSQIVQSFSGPTSFFGALAFWQNSLYVGGRGDHLKQFAFNPSTGLFITAPASKSTGIFTFPGATPSISSQGASNGIVWAIDSSQYGPPAPGPSPAIVHAFNANNLATEYWNSSQAPNGRDHAGGAVKFAPPTIANGHVYVSTRTEVTVYGLLP